MSPEGSRGTRTSCEHCRQKKARCQWSSFQEGARCDRCTKSGLVCTKTPMLPVGRPRLARRIALAKTSRPLQQQQQGIAEAQSFQADIRPSYPTGTQSSPSATTTEAAAPVERSDMASGYAEQSFTPGPGVNANKNAFIPSACQSDLHLPLLPPSRQLLDSEPFLWSTFNDQLSQWPPTEDLGVFLDQLASNSPSYLALEGIQACPAPHKSTDYYLDRLARLNAALTRKFTASDSAATAGGNRPTTCPMAGQLLRFAQEYLQITRHFMLAVPLTLAPSLATGTVTTESETDDDDDVVFCSLDTDDDAPGSESSDASSSFSAQDRPTMSSIEYPIMIALITAYSSLVRLHRNWLQTTLSALHTLTLRQEELFSNAPCRHMLDGYQGGYVGNIANAILPSALPGVTLDGFSLSRHRSLQIQIVSEISLELLWRAERSIACLAASTDDANHQQHQSWKENPLGERPRAVKSDEAGSYSSLLRTMLSQEAATTYRSSTSKAKTTTMSTITKYSIGWKSLKSMAKQIRKETRRNFCLQLDEGSFSSGIGNFDDL
ncbi:uncharacterized protein EI97DRAFT_444007 [Westerdykella ornata]|uniref:Zn(2)-C6 fungal-type domain-containing protein n=1 Tax=Westerdykella ornata TaxID=318751 RepID=A0A6A6JE91_WESOR|nr:uncharacterized protein EI97DRAFT_444007 [Westerdykella ornata]KAF2274534.1 hypothetical protein EI97DRAFT_444007 [Westerdykella ornata]